MEFARFLGLPPVSSRTNATDIADTVCQLLIDARCDVVVIDELHNINMATTAGEDHSDHMKYFTEHLPATFVFSELGYFLCFARLCPFLVRSCVRQWVDSVPPEPVLGEEDEGPLLVFCLLTSVG